MTGTGGTTEQPSLADVRRSWTQILFNRKMLTCIFLGFTSGMPLYVLISLVPAWLRSNDVNLATIGLFALIGLPYTWKFVWSPLMDRYKLPFLGRRRGWALLTQLVLLVAIGVLGQFDPSISLQAIVAVVFVVALFGASQDIVIDAYRRELLADDEHHRDDGLERDGGIELAQHADRNQQHKLRQKRPAPPAPQERQLVAVHQRGPDEFPGVGQPDQGEQTDRGQVDVVAAQPGRYQRDQHIERHPGGEAQEDAGEHLPVEQDLGPTALDVSQARLFCRSPGLRHGWFLPAAGGFVMPGSSLPQKGGEWLGPWPSRVGSELASCYADPPADFDAMVRGSEHREQPKWSVSSVSITWSSGSATSTNRRRSTTSSSSSSASRCWATTAI